MKEILLSRGKVAIVDDEDYEWLIQWDWEPNIRKLKSGDCCYATRRITRFGKRIRLHMHREIMQPPTDMVVDHIDGNGLNNQRSNLRVCTPNENRLNRKPTNKYKGVYLRYNGKYQAGLRIDGKFRTLGTYSTAEEAAAIVRAAEIKRSGEFANRRVREG